MTTTSETLDLAELTASLIGEVRTGIRASRDEDPDGIEVVGAVVRVGRRDGGADGHADVDDADGHQLDADDVDGDDRAPVTVALPRPSPITLRPEGDGADWEIELDLGNGDAISIGDAGLPDGDVGQPTAVGLWTDRHPSALKGIDTFRTAQLAEEGIGTIGDLLALDEEGIATLVSRLGSHRFLDFWVQAAMLRTSAPRFAASPADGWRLSDLAGLAPGRLRRLIGPEVCSASAATTLFDLLCAWGAALDRDAMSSATLGQLRTAVRIERG